ncbi:aldo/keto reductase [Acidipropionibacterium jensenii]|uniref:aldo/keto reductase n=1 Tax=Acidipropionibacterium TaxID=1912215 RepID=UPI0003F66C2E|nr:MULTISPECIES: aldo/keto reductase [Acidipropionibacterium]AZZ41410.1 aldo/keto reductase [Acidipropionibacterium jensenii]
MKYRKLGPYQASAISYGNMPLAIEGRPDRATAISVIHDVLDAGVTHIDTAWAYYPSGDTPQYGEELAAEALRTWSGDQSRVTIATKVGHFRNFTDGKPTWGIDDDPDHLKERAHESARALGVDTIDLLYSHRPSPDVPYEKVVGALADLIDEEVASVVGISNANPDQIRLAHRILGDRLVAVQNQFSPGFRSSEPEIEVTGELGLAFVAWSPLGGYRAALDQALFEPFQKIADARSVSRAQVILAWELTKGPHVIPIPGSHRSATILDSLRATDLELTEEELAVLG